jgi:hypothetical protein
MLVLFVCYARLAIVAVLVPNAMLVLMFGSPVGLLLDLVTT